jgi:hypothetical protein
MTMKEQTRMKTKIRMMTTTTTKKKMTTRRRRMRRMKMQPQMTNTMKTRTMRWEVKMRQRAAVVLAWRCAHHASAC